MILKKNLIKGAPKKKGGMTSFRLFDCRYFKQKARLPSRGISQSGQALTEALIALSLTSTCFIVCLLLFHGYTQQLWMDHQLYQSLICLAKGENKQHCKKIMIQKTKAFLWIGKIQNLKLYKKEEQWKGTLTWETPFWKIPFQKTLNLNQTDFLQGAASAIFPSYNKDLKHEKANKTSIAGFVRGANLKNSRSIIRGTYYEAQ